MVQDFSHATIRELIIALDTVERSILEAQTVSIDAKAGAQAPDPRLAQLAAQEQRITRELAVRRADMHGRRGLREVVR